MYLKSKFERAVYLFFVFLLIFNTVSTAETIYVNGRTGDNNNPGTKELPVRTIEFAAEMLNRGEGEKDACIKIAPGFYNLTKTVELKNSRKFSRENRLVIEAEIMPDDAGWKQESMPVILSTADYLEEPGEKYSLGFDIGVSHVTIRGLKFLGSPIPQVRLYPVWRYDKTLDDLNVSQCLFVGDRHVLPLSLAICVMGHGLVVDHCVFYNCENSVVFWNAEGGISRGNAMKYCIVTGAYSSGVWTCDTGDDFEFDHNIISGCEYFWMRSPGNKWKYKIQDCIVTGNRFYSGKGGASGITGETGPEITFVERNIIKDGKIELEEYKNHPAGLNELDRPLNYLHILPGTLGSELGAGLFKKKRIFE